jgi:hypothetical protein
MTQQAQKAQQARQTAPSAPKGRPLDIPISIHDRIDWTAELTHAKAELPMLLFAQTQVIPQQGDARDCLRHVEATLLAIHGPEDEKGSDLGIRGGGAPERAAALLPWPP